MIEKATRGAKKIVSKTTRDELGEHTKTGKRPGGQESQLWQRRVTKKKVGENLAEGER